MALALGIVGSPRKKGNTELLNTLNKGLAEIKADGTYEDIYERWIGVPPEEIP